MAKAYLDQNKDDDAAYQLKDDLGKHHDSQQEDLKMWQQLKIGKEMGQVFIRKKPAGSCVGNLSGADEIYYPI